MLVLPLAQNDLKSSNWLKSYSKWSPFQNLINLINSRTVIAGAIIGLLLVFFTFQRIWIVLGRCLFTTRRGVLEKSFFKSIFGVNFEAGNETREKIWSDFGAEQKWRAERKKSGFCSHCCFWECEKLMCEKNFFKWAKFFSRAAFKSNFLQLLMVLRFDYDIVLVLGLFW